MRLTPIAPVIRRYFYSGWAFLMPYLFVYLLYYGTKWPVNPANRGQMPDAGVQIAVSWMPCMLHIYWALHAFHGILAGFVLWSALRASGIEKREASSTGPLKLQPLNFNWSAKLTALAPWALLALIFYIPGVYLEWPSDPWMHLERITAWANFNEVALYPAWKKSFYFFAYSIIGRTSQSTLLIALDFYYVGACMLLCWQYYHFSRACGLGERASMLFVIIQALLFGNNIFSFYRYYGISSSIYAQLGAVALTRIVLEFAARGTKLDPDLRHREHRALTLSTQSETEGVEVGRGVPAEPRSVSNAILPKLTKNVATPLAHEPREACQLNVERSPVADNQPFSFSAFNPCLLSLIAAITCLLALTAFNHPQGIGIACLSIAAVSSWRLIEWKRSALWWLIGGTLVINALFIALYTRPAIIETYLAQGFLSCWYGFNILNPNSSAGARTLQIIGFAGAINITAACFLIKRNSPIAWLTLSPPFILSSPIVAIILSLAITRSGIDSTYIITFQRMLFVIPVGLALVKLCTGALRFTYSNQITIPASFHAVLKRHAAYILLIAFSFFATVSAPGAPIFNRFWHALYHTPDDTKLVSTWTLISDSASLSHTLAPTTGLVGIGCEQLLRIQNVHHQWLTNVNLANSGNVDFTKDLRNATYFLDVHNLTACLPVILINPNTVHTPYSLAGTLSQHWLPQSSAMDSAGHHELKMILDRHGYQGKPLNGGSLYVPPTRSTQ